MSNHSSIHMAYAEHLLNGHKPVHYGGALITFTPHMHGSGWFSDRWSGLKNSVKGIWNQMKPVVIQTGKELAKDAGNIAVNALKSGAEHGLASEGTIKQRILAGAKKAGELAKKDVKELYSQEKELLKKQIMAGLES